MAEPEKNPSALGLMGHAFLKAHKVHTFIDFATRVFRVPAACQKSQIEKHYSETLKQAGDRVRLNLAQEIPGAMAPTSNACNYFKLTIHEPHLWGFQVAELEKLMAAIGAKSCDEYDNSEFGIDFIPVSEEAQRAAASADKDAHAAYLKECGDFAEILLSRLKRPLGIDSESERGMRAFDPLIDKIEIVTGAYAGVSPCDRIPARIARLQTIYLGHLPGAYKGTGKDDKGKRLWRSGTMARVYFKTTDRGGDLPPDQHRLRIEFTSSCKQAGIDPMKLLAGDTSALNKAARCFAVNVPLNNLHALIRQRQGLSTDARTGAEIVPQIASDLEKQGYKRQRQQADQWNQQIVSVFIDMARRMKTARKQPAPASRPKLAFTGELSVQPAQAKPLTPAPAKVHATEGNSLGFHPGESTQTAQVLSSGMGRSLITTSAPPPRAGGRGGWVATGREEMMKPVAGNRSAHAVPCIADALHAGTPDSNDFVSF